MISTLLSAFGDYINRAVPFGVAVLQFVNSFNVGKFLFGFYLAHSATASSNGAAVAVLLWIYYSAQIFLLGAEFTKVHASRCGPHISACALRSSRSWKLRGAVGISDAGFSRWLRLHL